jgi:two-component system cell cycle response regulator
MKLLVADNSAFYRRMLKSLLESWNYQVLLAQDGLEALALLQGQDAPRIAILGGVMLGLSGPEICKAIRSNQREYVYTVLLSGNDEETDVIRGFGFGADDYLCKPFKEFELQARIKVGMRIIEAQDALLESQAALQFQATHDPLTQLWNRGGIMEVLKKELSRVSRSDVPLSICLADLDHFKQVNDTYGHLTGDEVLQSAGNRMSAALRDYDSLGRYGGEEFLAVLPGCNEEAASIIAERMRRSVGCTALLSSPTTINVTISLGVGEWQPNMDMHNLLSQADLALYRAKDCGRNRVETAGVHPNISPSLLQPTKAALLLAGGSSET